MAACATSSANVIESREAACTRDTLTNLKVAFERYYTEYRTLPAGDQRTIISALTATGAVEQNPRKVVFFEFRAPRPNSHFWTNDAVPGDKGADGLPVDAWGRSIICTVDSAARQVTLRSLGRNGRDDAGQPDDIVITDSPR
ncbi:hypothetical protein ACXR0O_25455 [Verrucomicrobiota bacterium sgz303538]